MQRWQQEPFSEQLSGTVKLQMSDSVPPRHQAPLT